MTFTEYKTTSLTGFTLQVDRWEAMQIIESLAAQVRAESPNVERKEWRPEYEIARDKITDCLGQRYFSIIVNQKEQL